MVVDQLSESPFLVVLFRPQPLTRSVFYDVRALDRFLDSLPGRPRRVHLHDLGTGVHGS
jgi:hypothetical protein